MRGSRNRARVRPRSLTVLALAFLILAAACTGDGDDSGSAETAAPAPGSDDPSPREMGLESLFEGVGVTIVDDLASAPPMTGLQVWTWQLENMQREVDRGGGYLGAELDDLAGAPAGVPFSYVLAGWITSGVSETSDGVLALMGDQDWENAPRVIFPKAATMLFVADALAAAAADGPQAAATGQFASLAQQGDTVCERVVGFVNDALDFIFEGLKIESDADGLIGFFVTVWNTAVDLARNAVEGLIKTITAPVLSVVTDALVVIGTLSTIASLLTPWGIELTPSRPRTRVAIGGEPDIRESFTASVDTNIDFEWPDEIRGCAAVAGLTLPEPSSAKGSPVEWNINKVPNLATANIPDIGTATTRDNFVGTDNTATLNWVTGRQETDEGDDKIGYFSATAVVTSDEAVELREMVLGFVRDQVPDGTPYASDIEGFLEELLAPHLDKLVEFTQIRGDASVIVDYHFKEDSDGVSLTIFNPQTGCEIGDPDSLLDSPEHQLVYPDGVLGDGRMDDVEYLIRVDGIDADKAVGLVLEIGGDELGLFVDWALEEQERTGGTIEPAPNIEIPIAVGTQIDEDTWTYRGAMPLGYELFVLDPIIVWSRIRFEDGSRVFESRDYIAVDELFREDREDCIDEPEPIEIGFRYLEQRHNVWVQAKHRNGDEIDNEYFWSLVSIDSDPAVPSTITLNGSESAIEPLGMQGYTHPLRTETARNTTASAGFTFDTEVTPSRIRVSGLYERTLQGGSEGGERSTAVAVAGTGVLFTFDGGPVDVVLAWSCDLEVGLMSIVVDDEGRRQRGDVFVDNNADECTGRYEGTLEAGVTYQLLANIGRFDERFATEGTVYSAAGDVLCECPNYNVDEAGDFRLDLTPGG